MPPLPTLSPWLTLLIFFGSWMVLWLPAAIPMAIALHWRPFQAAAPAQKLPLLAVLYLLGPLVLWGMHHWLGLSFTAMGLRWQHMGGSLVGGLGMGLLGIAGLYALRWWRSPPELGTDLKKNWRTQGVSLLALGGLALWVGFTEELIFRGFLHTELRQVIPPLWAGAIASAVFALLHLVWDGKGTVPQLPGLWLMGMVLTLARWLDGDGLGLAWGLHGGWVWGVAVVDTALGDRRWAPQPEWLFGIQGHPLAGGLGLLLLLGNGAIAYGLALVMGQLP